MSSDVTTAIVINELRRDHGYINVNELRRDHGYSDVTTAINEFRRDLGYCYK